MEALAAVSLTGNILQFIDTTNKLISSAHQVASQGTKAEYVELETVANELRDVATTIRARQLPDDILGRPRPDDALEQISAQCIDVADQLLSILDSLKLKAGSNGLRNFSAALRSEWKAGEIEALQKRLDRIGRAMKDHITTSQQLQISQKLDLLATTNERLAAGRQEDIEDLKRQIRTAFEGLRDELSTKASSDIPASAILLSAAEKGIRYSAEQIILQRFRFDTIDHRYETIPSAHLETFSWIFKSKTEDGKASPSFAEWLTSADSLYWISGKPGSGKSTLMKYLSTHKETKRMLRHWAKEDHLILASFFFWNAGQQSLQKSQLGLLRSLIYQILRQCPTIIQQVYPDISQLDSITLSGDHRATGCQLPGPSMSVTGLIATLRVICSLLAASNTRLCLFIDGLDEYEGKPSDIIELIGALRSIEHVKVCASSRPWTEFEHSFGQDGARKLYMQNLTKGDIQKYVRDTFERDENYQSFEGKDKEGAVLINEIIEAAQGVFLWVILVVRSLQEGLMNGDRIVDLQRRLREYPKDLNEYFEKILFSDVAEFYRPQSARLFSIALNACRPLPALSYWFLDQEDPDHVFNLPICPLSPQQLESRLKQTRKRLNACCKGLLEVYDYSDDRWLPKCNIDYRVDFLHRTVRDFLTSPESQKFLLRWNNQQSPDTDKVICSALLSVLKTTPPEHFDTWIDRGLARMFQIILVHAKSLDDNLDCELSWLAKLLDDLDTTILALPAKKIDVGDLFVCFNFARVCGLDSLDDVQANLLYACTEFGLNRFVDQKLCGGTGITILNNHLRVAKSRDNYVMLRLLLRKGADPNAIVYGVTIWERFLRDLRHGACYMTESDLYLTIRDFLEHGARIGIKTRDGYVVEAYDIVQRALTLEHMALIEHFFASGAKQSGSRGGLNFRRRAIPRRGMRAIIQRLRSWLRL